MAIVLAAHVEVKGATIDLLFVSRDYNKNSQWVSAPVLMKLDVLRSAQQGSRMAQSDYLILGLVPIPSAT